MAPAELREWGCKVCVTQSAKKSPRQTRRLFCMLPLLYMKIFFIAVFVLIVLGGGYAYYNSKYSTGSPTPSQSTSPPTELKTTPRSQMSAEQADKVKVVSLAPEIESVLSQQMGSLMTLGVSSVFLNEVLSANEKNKELTFDDITRLDDEWIASKNVTPFIYQLLSNEIAKQLSAFQDKNQSFKEIFVADARGLNIGLTNKTSDYYQADESWWVNAYNGGSGRPLHGNIEFDQSAQTEAISIYVPVMKGDKAIGVIKGVIDLSAIKSQL